MSVKLPRGLCLKVKVTSENAPMFMDATDPLTEQYCLKILKVQSIVLKLNIVFSHNQQHDKFLTKCSPFKLYQDLFLAFNNWKQDNFKSRKKLSLKCIFGFVLC